MDIFEKCYAPSLAGELKEKGVYPYFHALQSRQDVEVMMEGKRRIMLGSNNYLGLTTDPVVVEAGIKALEQYGTGCSGSRFLNGTLEMHLELEDALAKFLRKPGVVTFGTGFQSNVGIISALVGRHDYVICDRENHASIYAGCQMSYGKMLRYRHSDMAELEKCLQRVPETESSGRIHTSAASIAVLPEVDDVEVKIDPNDVRVDVYRASGNGGQCVNTTDSAVRLTHIPTGLVVTCQDEKSQIKNKDKAFKVLKARLYDLMLQEQNDKISAERRSQVGSGDRSERIRTYNFPQGRVTDHRINLTIYKLENFLDGDLDEIIDALITHDQAEKMKSF